MTEHDSLLVLNAIPGLGPVRCRQLLEHFGTARAIFSLKEKDFIAVGLPAEPARSIQEFPCEDYLKSEHVLMERHSVRLVTYQDDEYPANLKEIHDAPLVLYVIGHLLSEDRLSIAIVGSRRASMYGLTMAEKFAVNLAECGVTIVSGLAKGIDAAAHRGALKAKGRTIAVMGCGLTHIYPPDNRNLFEQIANTGAIVSEFPMTMPPLAHNFPQRNRIISGLALGVVVAEASCKSGALLTSRFALEQGREVFAVPGKVDNPNALGVNNLIKQGAKLIISLEDILEEIQFQVRDISGPSLRREISKAKVPQGERVKCISPMPAPTYVGSGAGSRGSVTDFLKEEEQHLLACLSDRPIHVDDLAIRCGHSVSRTMAKLLSLEIRGAAKQLPGKLFVASPH